MKWNLGGNAHRYGKNHFRVFTVGKYSPLAIFKATPFFCVKNFYFSTLYVRRHQALHLAASSARLIQTAIQLCPTSLGCSHEDQF